MMAAENLDKGGVNREPAAGLPGEIPVFPLRGALLLPRGHLPLNIFEPRFIEMVDDALRGDRMIGMIQTRLEMDGAGDKSCALFRTGCAGRITHFEETPDGRYVITLTGICRFDVDAEIETGASYRKIRPDWSRYVESDLRHSACLDLNRPRLKALLQEYFEQNALSCTSDIIDGASDDKIVTCLAMICPLGATEKQALLEEICCRARAEKFIAMLEMAVRTNASCGGCH